LGKGVRKTILVTRTLIAAITALLIGINSTYVGFINSISIEFYVGIGFLVAGIYLMRKFVKDRKKSTI
jgi:uncharacterized membrane protein HdeD (DUF308 family)